MTVTGYRIILPRHWVHIQVHGDARAKLQVFVDEAVSAIPKSTSPDEIGPLKRALEQRLLRQVEASKAQGGRDLYLPGPNTNGLLLGASIVVSEIELAGGGEGADAEVMALLVADKGRGLQLDGSHWVRHEQTVGSVEMEGHTVEVPTRRVTYTGRRPEEANRWMLVAFSCTGDGDPASANTSVVVDLFDAVMGTWVWARDDDPAAVLPQKETV